MEKILVADDSAAMRQMISMILRGAGYEVILSVDGKDALSRFSPEIGLVMTDLNMPNMNGIEFIRSIRAGSSNRSVPVLMVTTESENDLKLEGKKAGATGWLVKPFSREQLLRSIEKILGKTIV